MLKNNVFEKLHSLNIHMGHISFYNSELNFFIIGKRFNYSIINIHNTFLLIKKSLHFVNNLSQQLGNIIFFYESFLELPIVYRCILISVAKSTNQQIVAYNWRYSSISNYFFSFYKIIQQVSNLWFIKDGYLHSEINKNSMYTSFLNYNKEYYTHNYFDFILSSPVIKHGASARFYNMWYRKWLKKQTSYKLWTLKKKSLKETDLLKKMCLGNVVGFVKKQEIFKFQYLFIKFSYYISTKKKDPFFLNIESFINSSNHFLSMYKKIWSFWRFLLYFKYFNNYLQLPDALFTVFPNRSTLSANEYTSAGLTSIGIVDTDCSHRDVNYPIVSNDDSIMIVVFFFTLFSNCFKSNNLNIYKFFKTFKI